MFSGPWKSLEYVPEGREREWPLLRRMNPAQIGTRAPVEERQNRCGQHRRVADLVVREIRNNGEPILRHVLAHPAGILQPTAEQLIKRDDVVGPDVFAVGDFVDAIGMTKGRGFEGVVKRHGFRGGDQTHGAKGWKRRSGAIGQRLFPGTVMRGMKMPGHMGQVQRTTQNLEVVQVRPEDNVILIKGAIPGSKGDYVVIRESKKRGKTALAAKKPAAAAKK